MVIIFHVAPFGCENIRDGEIFTEYAEEHPFPGVSLLRFIRFHLLSDSSVSAPKEDVKGD